MAEKLTPGPWYAEDYTNENGPEFYVIPETNFGTVAKVFTGADARLIAQAPAMLEALKEAEDHMILMYSGIAGGNAEAGQRFADNDPVVAVIRNVIAAATGEAP